MNRVVTFLEGLFDAFNLGLSANIAGDVVTKIAASLARDILTETLSLRGIDEQQAEDLRTRAMKASAHLAEAANIFAEFQLELGQRQAELTALIDNIDRRRGEAVKWQREADERKKQVELLAGEIEALIRGPVRKELDRNLRRRQLLSLVFWVLTILISGVVSVWLANWRVTHDVYNQFIAPWLP